MKEELLAAARTAVVDCVGLRSGETCLVLTDPARDHIGRALWEVARDLAREALLVVMTERSRDGEEPPAAVAELMAQMDVVLAATNHSLTHTKARRAACAAGARVATLPGILESTMVRCLNADYQAIAARTERVAARLTEANEIRVRTAAGTDLRFRVDGIAALASTGLIREPGAFGNLPSGEAYLRPREGTANGRVVVDGSMASIGDLTGTPPIVLTVAEGMVTRIEGGQTACALDDTLRALGAAAYTLAEFGVGTNDAARIVGNILEDEKVLGTIHIALGNNVSMGGSVTVPIHLDGVVLAPTVELDGEPLLLAGDLLV